MNVHWEEGVVTQIDREEAGLQYVQVRRRGGSVEKAIHYVDGSAPLLVGDEVILNTTAVDLALGSGGYHFVAWHRGALAKRKTRSGHIMKLRYTPWQFAVLAAEEETSDYHDRLKHASELKGMPVLAAELHSMLPVLVASLRHIAHRIDTDLRIVYVMTDGAALPIKMSRHVQWLRRHYWLAGTVTVGHAYGGDLEAVNIYSGLLAAKHVLRADVAIVLMGPGIVGTGTRFGFTGIEQGQTVNAVHALGGDPIVVPRISFADTRERHRGMSHHTITNLSHVILRPTKVALPEFQKKEWQDCIDKQRTSLKSGKHKWVFVPISEAQLHERLREFPYSVTSMGRGVTDDPAFFLAVSCAADVAWMSLTGRETR